MRTNLLLIAALLLDFSSLAHAAMQTKTIDYTAHGKAMRGVLVWDDAVKTARPGLLMIPDWRGINASNIEFAKTIAKSDYVIFMGDMYGKDLRPANDTESMAAIKPLLGNRPEMRARVVGAFDELKELAQEKSSGIDATRLAAIGFCFGGSSVLDLARSGTDVAAVVSFHGGLSTDDPNLARNIKASVLAMNGADDKGTMPDADKFMDEMRMSPAEWQFVVFGHSVHCFAEPQADNPPGCVYNPKAAKPAFKLMHDWLDEAFAM